MQINKDIQKDHKELTDKIEIIKEKLTFNNL